MKREDSIKALLRKAKADYAGLRSAYDSSVSEKIVREDLKVAIKNILENLRSCLDYLAQDIFDKYCSSEKKPDRLYFPIRSTKDEFIKALTKDYPNLQIKSMAVFDILEAAQPYHDPWLGHFNKLNNHNKHQNLIEQTRTESRRVTVSRDGGSVSWGPGVKFGSGVGVMGVPIDPRTQMPVPNTLVKTEVVIYVEYRFKEIDQPVIPFMQASLHNVEKIFQDLQPHI